MPPAVAAHIYQERRATRIIIYVCLFMAGAIIAQ
jgi:hypothetical protein